MLTRTSGGIITNYQWEGWNCIKESTSTSTTRYYCPENEIHGFERDGTLYQMHLDALGSCRLVTNAAGIVVASLSYDAWGNLLPNSVDSVPGGMPYKYIGGLGLRLDPSTGLIFMRNRWYDPAGLQRFISRDPLHSSNRYCYCDGNPVSFIDPSGLIPSSVGETTCNCDYLTATQTTLPTAGMQRRESLFDSFLTGAFQSGAAAATGALVVAALPFEIPAAVAWGVGGVGVTLAGRRFLNSTDPNERAELVGSMVLIPFTTPAFYQGPVPIGVSSTSFEMIMVRGFPRFSFTGRTINVAVHSDELGFFAPGGTRLTPLHVAKIVSGTKGYQPGMSVRLISCEGTGQAKALSELLGGAKIFHTSGGAGGIYPYPFVLSENPFSTYP